MPRSKGVAVLVFATLLTFLAKSFADNLVLSTDYLEVIFDSSIPAIISLSADFHGGKNFTNNLLTEPIVLKILQAGADGKHSKLSLATDRDIQISQDQSTAHDGSRLSNLRVAANLRSVGDNSLLLTEKIVLSLNPNLRSVDVSISGELLSDISAVAMLYGVYVKSPSLYTFTDKGVFQMMGKDHACLGLTDDVQLDRTYFIGHGGALDVIINDSEVTHENIFISSTTTSYQSALEHTIFGSYPYKSREMETAWNPRCWSEISINQVFAKGSTWSFEMKLYPNNYDFPVYLLSDLRQTSPNLPFIDLRSYLTAIYSSPVGCLQSYYQDRTGMIAPTIAHPDIGYSPNTNFFDPDNYITLSAMLYSGERYLIQQVREVLQRTAETICGIGQLQDYQYCQVDRQRIPASRRPLRIPRYHQLHQQQQQQQQSSSSSQYQHHHQQYASTSRTGQIMHHFINFSPTYESIAGSEQLGPNIFWTLMSIRYISVSQDLQYAESIFPYLDLSVKFVLSFIDDTEVLVLAPGPLYIDVLVRENFTSDSNAMMVPFLREVADYYDLMDQLGSNNHTTTTTSKTSSMKVNDDQQRVQLHARADLHTFAEYLRDLAERITTAMNKKLFIGKSVVTSDSSEGSESIDHYITQVNLDGSTRDFIDYDANLIAVGYSVQPDESASRRILTRIDSNPVSHVRATWCSEVKYSGDREDCYIVGGDTCGDSVVTLARIGYADALARKRLQDGRTVRQVLLSPLMEDLWRDIWMYERYDANGTAIRTSYYFEYPALIVMVLREVVYGINFTPMTVVVDPLLSSLVESTKAVQGSNETAVFVYHLGDIYLSFSPEEVVLSVPTASRGSSGSDSGSSLSRVWTIKSLHARAKYHISFLQGRETQSEASKAMSLFSDIAVSDAAGVLQFKTDLYQEGVLHVRLIQ